MKLLVLIALFRIGFLHPEEINAEFNVGFNQAWLKSNYAHQWTDKDYDQSEVKRLLDLTQKAGSKTIRMWLFEGADSNALIWKDGKVAGLHPDFLKNFQHFLTEAKARGIKVYPTLFSPGALDDSKDRAINERWWNLYNNKQGAMDAFQTNALEPLMKLINKSENKDSVFGIDVANEIDTGVLHDKFENGWSGANAFICGLKKKINPIPVTSSIGWGKAIIKKEHGIGIHRGAENIILDPNPYPNCVDFWDIHIYRDSGEIKNCEAIKALSEKYKKKIYLGEFGQDSKRFDHELQKTNAENFIKNAKQCGFSGALAWRLSDVRDGVNPEARFSLEANGKNNMRPAYEVIRQNNLKEALCENTSNKCSNQIKESVNDSHLNLKIPTINSDDSKNSNLSK